MENQIERNCDLQAIDATVLRTTWSLVTLQKSKQAHKNLAALIENCILPSVFHGFALGSFQKTVTYRWHSRIANYSDFAHVYSAATLGHTGMLRNC